MAEKITRTTKATTFVVQTVNPIEMTFGEMTFNLSGTPDPEKQLTKLQKLFNRDDRIITMIKEKTVSEELREMSLDDWIKYSKPVDQKDVVEYNK